MTQSNSVVAADVALGRAARSFGTSQQNASRWSDSGLVPLWRTESNRSARDLLPVLNGTRHKGNRRSKLRLSDAEHDSEATRRELHDG
jgi:hypothetical protein